MLAGLEKAFQAGLGESLTKMTALQSLLAGFFDYAGLYPPASLSLRSAANNYLDYARGKHASVLGRFIINLDRLDELRSIVGEDALKDFRLSVIASDISALDVFSNHIEMGVPIEALEIKCAEPETIQEIATRVPSAVKMYVEVPFDSKTAAVVKVIANVGARAKIRMGGVVPGAFPSVSDVVRTLKMFAKLRVPFKATAGLHHPIRSSQPLTYDPQSARETMHGFLNLVCASAVLYFGGQESDAEEVLRDEDLMAWQMDHGSLRWRHLSWTQDQISTLRLAFFISIGSCSFAEPICDLEALGWL